VTSGTVPCADRACCLCDYHMPVSLAVWARRSCWRNFDLFVAVHVVHDIWVASTPVAIADGTTLNV
jgi:hypothetical protein